MATARSSRRSIRWPRLWGLEQQPVFGRIPRLEAIRIALGLESGVSEAPLELLESTIVVYHQLEPLEPARSPRRRRCPGSGPRVDAQVVVVAARGQKERPRIAADRDIEAEQPAIERLGLVEVGDVQVHVPDPDLRRHPVLARAVGVELTEHAFQVEGQRVHPQLAIGVAPFLAGTIAVDLDAVPLGIGEVERLRYQVI